MNRSVAQSVADRRQDASQVRPFTASQPPRPARKLQRSRTLSLGRSMASARAAMYGYEDCADDLAMLLKEFLAAEIER